MARDDDVEQLEFTVLRREHPRSFFERYMLRPFALVRSRGELQVYCYLEDLPLDLEQRIIEELRQRFPQTLTVRLGHLPFEVCRQGLVKKLDRAYGSHTN